MLTTDGRLDDSMSGAGPLVSVVIPTYNHGRFVTAAVESVLAQTYKNVEVIVVDDGSQDNTRERLLPYEGRIRYIFQDNQGLSAARNTGIRASRGPFVALLDADDEFHPRKLEYQMAFLAAHPEISFLATDEVEGMERPPWQVVRDSPSVVRVLVDDLILRTRFGTCGVVIRKSCFDDVGLFDESLRSVEDRDMWIRLGSRFPIYLMKAPLWWYRIVPGSMSRNPERMEHFERVVLDKAFGMPEFRSRWALERRATSVALLSAAYMYVDCGNQKVALQRAIRSLVIWPLPLRRRDTYARFARLRVVAGVLRRMAMGVCSRDRELVPQVPANGVAAKVTGHCSAERV